MNRDKPYKFPKIKLSGIIAVFFITMVMAAKTYAAFSIEVDSFVVDFGLMNINESKDIQEKGTYQNEITCQSDNANTWYLQVQTLGPLKSGAESIPNSYFEWKVAGVANGDGIVYNENKFNPFSNTPMNAYTSGPGDKAGRKIDIRFSYRLTIPKNQVPGNYRTIIRYIMTETL